MPNGGLTTTHVETTGHFAWNSLLASAKGRASVMAIVIRMLTSAAAPVHPTRAIARSTKGMVASPHALASAAGAAVLRSGGNAVDAAIATNGVLSVVYPQANGFGGDAFWLVYEPEIGDVVAYNGSGRAPNASSAENLRERGMTEMPARGGFAVTVPGAVRSWEDVLESHGSRTLDSLLEPAEAYARDGYVVTEVVAYYLELNAPILAQCPAAAELFLRNGVPSAGTVLNNRNLAKTIAQVRNGGADAFYLGPAGEAIVARLRAAGVSADMEDLASHRTERTTPWRLEWRGGEVLSHPPNSHGSCAQVVLGALASDDPHDEAGWTHLAIEAFKGAFEIRDTLFGDPDFVDILEEEIIGRRVLERLRAGIDPRRATAQFRPPHLARRTDRGDTIAIVAVDDDGRAVSLIQSLYMNFGSGLVAGDSGVVLQNRGAYFNLIEGHPNELCGGHRPVHTLSPAMFLRAGKPELVYGTMGGDGQPQIHVQFLHNVVDRRMDIQAALDSPRWIAGRPHVPGREDVMTDTVVVESRMPDDLLEGLTARGHSVERLAAFDHTMGHAHAIRIDRESGTFAGGADPRADSLALGV
jgi:gamma-glutamyltranspeptidase